MSEPNAASSAIKRELEYVERSEVYIEETKIEEKTQVIKLKTNASDLAKSSNSNGQQRHDDHQEIDLARSALDLAKTGFNYHKERKFMAAIDYYQAALRMNETEPSSPDDLTVNQLAVVHFQIGNCLQSEYKYLDALYWHKKALELTEETGYQDDQEFDLALNVSLAKDYFYLNRHRDVKAVCVDLKNRCARSGTSKRCALAFEMFGKLNLNDYIKLNECDEKTFSFKNEEARLSFNRSCYYYDAYTSILGRNKTDKCCIKLPKFKLGK